MLITCEGSVSHVSNSFNIPTLCLIQRSRLNKLLLFLDCFYNHMKKIKKKYIIYRSNDIKQIIESNK